MKYYQELTILPSYDVPAYFIWSRVYQQIHLGFVEHQDQNGVIKYGVSFPEYQMNGKEKQLGNKLRIFAQDEVDLKNLDLAKCLSRLVDYVHFTGIRKVPGRIEYAVYGRVHQENSQTQRIKRFVKRHGVSYEEAEKLYPMKLEKCEFPYIQMQSLTNHNPFRLYVCKTVVTESQNKGFGSYVLSAISTVPEF